MSNLLVIAVAGILLAIVVKQTAGWRSLPRPKNRPTWLGPEPTEIEGALLTHLSTEGGIPPGDPALQELAAHHAWDMAVRNYPGPVDPEGRGLDDRRARLHPNWIGLCVQIQERLRWEGSPDAQRVARQLLNAMGSSVSRSLLTDTPQGGWTALGLSVAVHGHDLALCMVLGQHWATLDHEARAGSLEGQWVVQGSLAPGIGIPDLELEAIKPQTPEQRTALQAHENEDEPGKATRFWALVPSGQRNSGWTFVRGNAKGRPQRVPGT